MSNSQWLIGSGSTSGMSNGAQISSLNTISLGNITNSNLWDSLNINFKRYEVIESNEDVLALSVAWKRLRDNRENAPIYVNSLLNHELYQKLTLEDTKHANTIRDYFSKKIMVWTLKEFKLSSYRQDLSEFIHGDGKKITEKMLPLVFRLPEFYEYDVEFDKFKQLVRTELAQFKMGTQHKVTTLTPVKSFYKSNKRIKQFEYWLKDSNDNAYMIAIEPKNPLKHIWDNLYTNDQLRIEASCRPKQYDDLQYYQLVNWTLV